LPVSDQDLAELAREAASELGVVGAQIAVLHNGDVVEAAAGLESIDTRIRMSPDTLVAVGSTTKVLTAALVMQLVEDDAIELDAPVVEQLPEFALSDADATQTVTPRHLLSMSSGIDNGPYTDYGRGDDALSRYVRDLVHLQQVFAPGTGFGYSNASTNVSGRLIEHATGLNWENVLATRLLAPAGLIDSSTWADDIIVRRFARGHGIDTQHRPRLLPYWSLGRSRGPSGGTLFSTATDLVRFAHIFLDDGRSITGEPVLSSRTVHEMQARQVAVPPTLLAEWWGLGPYGKVWDGVEIMGHSGTALSGSSYLLWARERGLAIAATVNTPALGYPFAARIFRELFRDIAGVVVPERPRPPAAVRVDTGALVGTYAMHGLCLTVREANGGVTIEGESHLPAAAGIIESSPLIPLSARTFLPTSDRIDGRRGWALAFLGADGQPASHLVNGFFNLRRVHG
jgi:CubicO group peptidase (beta-lactamase class C family)